MSSGHNIGHIIFRIVMCSSPQKTSTFETKDFFLNDGRGRLLLSIKEVKVE